jgi:selenide,water dikinase
MDIMSDNIKLTEFSHGGGCGCKIAPNILEDILKSQLAIPDDNKLLVGNHSKDDAAVYDLDNGLALISTTDFFMPIVDDAFDFGRIASANAISDVYAMGGKPILALAILGWPVNSLPADLAKKVIEGSRSICAEAGISLAGGHSIDTKEPMFGLAVNGLVNIGHLKTNNSARKGDLLFITKPIGVGILATAQKRKLLTQQHSEILVKQLTQLNKIGEELGKIEGVHAMTDITGFGIMGHLIEMIEGSKLGARLYYDRIPQVEGVAEYLAQKVVPDSTNRNWNSYSNKVRFEAGVNITEALTTLPDPQTNGGLLISVSPASAEQVIELFQSHDLHAFCKPVGIVTEPSEKIVTVHNAP